MLLILSCFYSVVKEILRCERKSILYLIAKKDEEMNTPLHLASMYGHCDVATLLLKAEADPDTRLVILK